MVKPLKIFFAALAVALSGCILPESRVEWHVPKLYDSIDPAFGVYVAWTHGAARDGVWDRNGSFVSTLLASSFNARAAKVRVAKKMHSRDENIKEARDVGCRYLVESRIIRWEYGSEGWSGNGRRDDFLVEFKVLDVALSKVLACATATIENGVLRSPAGGGEISDTARPVVDAFVSRLYNPPQKSFWEIKWDD